MGLVEPLTLLKAAFIQHKQECNGICVLCRSMSWQGAEPMAEHIYCSECENRTVVGIQKALELGIVRILNAVTH